MGHLRFTPDSVIETRPDGVLELGRWHAGLTRTWLANGPFEPARAQVPSDPLLMPDGRPRPYAPDPEREILSDIPFAIRAVAAPFGDAQWLALEAMRYIDGFVDFLRQEGRAPAPTSSSAAGRWPRPAGRAAPAGWNWPPG